MQAIFAGRRYKTLTRWKLRRFSNCARFPAPAGTGAAPPDNRKNTGITGTNRCQLFHVKHWSRVRVSFHPHAQPVEACEAGANLTRSDCALRPRPDSRRFAFEPRAVQRIGQFAEETPGHQMRTVGRREACQDIRLDAHRLVVPSARKRAQSGTSSTALLFVSVVGAPSACPQPPPDGRP